MYDFKQADQVEMGISEDLVIVISLFFTLVFFALTITKLQMSILLNSRALLKDGYCSLFGTILACSLFLNTIIVASIPRLWWLDPLVTLFVGIASLFLGLRSVLIQTFEKKIPIWNPKWWIFSQGDVSVQEMSKIEEAHQQAAPPPPILYDDLDGPKLSTETSTKDVEANVKTEKENDGEFIDLSLDNAAENGVRETTVTTASNTQDEHDNEIL